MDNLNKLGLLTEEEMNQRKDSFNKESILNVNEASAAWTNDAAAGAGAGTTLNY